MGGAFGGTEAKSDDRLRTQKTEEQMCGAKSPAFPRLHIDPHRELARPAPQSMLASRAANIKPSQLYRARIYEPFQNINSALFEVSVNNHSCGSPGVDASERWHASITRDVRVHEMDLFFIARSPEAVVKEECELSP